MLDEKNSVTDFCGFCLGSYLCFLLTGTGCDGRFGREPDHLHTCILSVLKFCVNSELGLHIVTTHILLKIVYCGSF